MDASIESAYKEVTNDYTYIKDYNYIGGTDQYVYVKTTNIHNSSFALSLLHLFNDSLLTSILSVVSAISVLCARQRPACGLLKGALH